ncbi:MAG: molybdopterin-dependent oxidoreductase, partial [Thermodesulfovibrionia bacterium]|nr:molybdopterin-dependent oxidoreductase [Thermodesulfovibrionia bacterium]
QAAHDKKVKALYIIGSDPASNVSHQKVREALESAEFIVHQDIFLNETAKLADVVLPCLSFAEKDGTFTNTERRVQKINKALEPSGSSKPDLQIMCEIAKKSGSKGFDFSSPDKIMTEISSLVPLYKHISYGALKEEGMQLIFHQDENIQKGRFKFTPIDYKAPSEKADIDYPLILISERDIYSAGFLSRKVEGLQSLRAKGKVYLNPKDALDFEIEDGKIVKVISRHGEIEGEAKITHASPAGIVTMSLAEEEMHLLINPSQEQISDFSGSKMCAVRIIPEKESSDE